MVFTTTCNVDVVDAPGIEINHVYTVSDNGIALRIETAEIARGRQVDYAPEADDFIRDDVMAGFFEMAKPLAGK
ncbi:hypothetical protein Lepto7375DRAFT_2937 [Leptolyngbya sp. PCC 7375]|nr:hypothetical protein Lepto7375DRAFT_2937 [Leptolyngbya sp. PCC 7375]